MLRPETNYNLLLALNGTTATLVVNNQSFFTYTFAPRVDADGFTYVLNEGMVGIGTDNAKGRIDNVAVQVLPPEITMTSTDDFSTESGLLVPDVGSWQLGEGQYTGTPLQGSSLAESLAQLNINPAYQLQLDMLMQAQSTGGVVFDRYSATDFKYAALSLITDQIVIGHYTERRGWVVDAFTSLPLDSTTNYMLSVILKGNVVTVNLDGLEVLSKAFNALVVDGEYGLLSMNGSSSYDQLTIRTNDPGCKTPVDTDDPPTLAIKEPTSGAVVSGYAVIITADATDDMGLVKLEFFIDGISIGFGSNSPDGWILPWNSTHIANGDHILKAVATDTKGLISVSSVRIKVNNAVAIDAPPIVTITSPANGGKVSGNSVSITANATDDADVTRVEFFINGNSIGVDTNGSDGWSILWNSTGVTDGNYTLSATATDTIGQKTSTGITVTVGNAVVKGKMRVAALSATSTKAKAGKWNASVTITIQDLNGTPLSGAVVNVAWSDGIVTTCTTGADGKCINKRSNIASTIPSLTLRVTNVTLPGYEYDPTASVATSIIVRKPT